MFVGWTYPALSEVASSRREFRFANAYGRVITEYVAAGQNVCYTYCAGVPAIGGFMRKITCLILALTLALLCGCGSGDKGTDAQDSGNTQQTEEFVITPMASGLELVPYSCADFSMSIPEGWTVEAATSNAGMYHALRAYDPACSVNQILYILKAEPMFVDDFLKQNYTYWNAAYAAYPVMAEESVKGYFEVLPQYMAAVAAEPFYSSLHFPQYEDFTVTETFDAAGSLGGTAGVLRAEFTQDSIEAEGMCSVELVPFPIPGLGGYYMAYSTTIVSAEKGMFQNWEDILTRSLGSLDYSGSYTSSAMAQSDAAMQQSQQLSQSANEMQDAIMSSWESRNTSQDIISQKQSDATMGFERVMDTETGEIYQTDNGFTDWYDGERYTSIADDQYTEAVVGRFSWK